MLDPGLVLYFSAAASQTSITKAAAILGVNVSSMSRKLDALELEMGVRLFERSSRIFSLTEAGQTYLHYVQRALLVLEAGRIEMERYNSHASGSIRVACPPMLGRAYVAQIVVEFSRLHPNLHIALQLDSCAITLQNCTFDVGICVDMPMEERAVVSKLGAITLGFVATPQFIAQHGQPRNLTQLAALPIAVASYEERMQEKIWLTDTNGNSIGIAPKLSTSEYEVVRQAATSSSHTGYMVHAYCVPELASGALRMLLPEHNTRRDIYCVTPSRKGNPLKIRLLCDFLKQHLGKQLLDAEANLAATYSKFNSAL